MGVTVTASTIIGGYTPICNCCGVALCWDISDEEYREAQGFWDEWRCSDCNPDYQGALQRWKARQAVKSKGGGIAKGQHKTHPH